MNHEREQRLPLSQTNTQEKEKLPHSGNFEGKLRENHYDEDNSSSVQEFQGLDTDQLQKVVPAPETSGTLILTPAEQPAFKEKYTALVESHKPTESHTRRNVTLGTASLLLVGGTIGGVVALNNQPSNTPLETEPSATSTPVAGETQAPAPTNTVESPLASPTNLGPLETPKPTTAPETQKPTVEVMPAALEQYKVMTAEQFAALPKSEQLTYWSWQSRNLDEFAKEWYETTLDPRDKLVAASETNTAQEIAAIQGFKIKFIFSIEDDLEREKALTAVLYEGKGSDSYPFWKDILKQIPSDMLNIELLAKNVTASASVLPVGPRGVENGVTIQDYTHVDGSHPTRNFYVPYTDARTGAQSATWIRQ